MKSFALKSAVAAFALATASASVAQGAGHGGMTMPMPPEKTAAAKKPVAKKTVAKKAGAHKAVAKAPAAKSAPQAEAPVVDHSQMDMAPPSEPASPPADHGEMDHSQMDQGQMDMGPEPSATTAPVDHSQMDMGHGAPGGHEAMRGALGTYASTREASGTAWQPDSSQHSGLMLPAGDWMLMFHGTFDLIADWQGGPRGDDKLFTAGMLMGMATRPVRQRQALQFRAMVSPDPLMGKKRLSACCWLAARPPTASITLSTASIRMISSWNCRRSYLVKLADKASAFLYAGLPGEPAFGPPAFMHRQSISISPEAPISHHWLDSTHITFGVVTAGLVLDRFKLEASRFNGREPDQHRWDIETGPLDSTSVRLSWNPTRNLSLQGSWAHLEEPEQLEPGINQNRWSASAAYTRPMANGWWSTTLAWGRKTVEGHDDDAFALESSVNWKDWTLFGRGEITENRELVESEDGHGPAYRVGKVSLGLVRDFRVAEHLKLGLGGLYAFNFVPNALEDAYGGDPQGAMAFVRLKLD